MSCIPRSLIAAFALAIGLIVSAQALANGQFKARLDGFQEAPSLSTPAIGDFSASVRSDQIEFTLSYEAIPTAVTQAHIHLGQPGVNGGVIVFLCSNLPAAPPGTQSCPETAGTVTGLLGPADVIGPVGQGIEAGDFAAFLRALEEGFTYVNVHSTQFPPGEIRGQIRRGRGP